MLHDLRTSIEHMTEFPAMLELARKILVLGRQPEPRDLAAIIELDPGVAGLMIRYAASPFFVYGGKIHSIRDAIGRVLGMQRALNIALGAVTSKACKGPLEGPLGRNAVWLHAVYSASLMQVLAERASPSDGAVAPGFAYLCGLMHNIGFLLLGHLYPDDIRTLNQVMLTDADAAVTVLEADCSGPITRNSDRG